MHVYAQMYIHILIFRITDELVWLRVPLVGLTCRPAPEGRVVASSACHDVLRLSDLSPPAAPSGP